MTEIVSLGSRLLALKDNNVYYAQVSYGPLVEVLFGPFKVVSLIFAF